MGFKFDPAHQPRWALEQQDQGDKTRQHVGEHPVLVHIREQFGLALDLSIKHCKARISAVGGRSAGSYRAIRDGEGVRGADGQRVRRVDVGGEVRLVRLGGALQEGTG